LHRILIRDRAINRFQKNRILAQDPSYQRDIWLNFSWHVLCKREGMRAIKENSMEQELAHAALVDSGSVHLAISYTQLFTVEEAFVRLGQSRQNGELLVLNKDESIQVFVEDGFIVQAIGKSEQGEAAVIHALNLESANFVWAAESKPLERDIHIDIRQYVLRHSLTRDQKIAQTLEVHKRETLALPKTDTRRTSLEEKLNNTGYYFVTATDPMGKVPLKRTVTLIGREIYCDWAIEDARISRKHCVLQIASQGILVRDLEATNGTFINGKLITDGYLKPGDKLSLGGYIMTLRGGKKVPGPASGQVWIGRATSGGPRVEGDRARRRHLRPRVRADAGERRP